MPEGAYDWYEMGNMDTQVDQIVRGRAAAAAFCERAAALLPAARDGLLAAAGHYRREVALTKAAFEPFIPAYDGDDGPREAWLTSEAKREAGADSIGSLLAEEQAAVAALQTSLEAIHHGSAQSR